MAQTEITFREFIQAQKGTINANSVDARKIFRSVHSSPQAMFLQMAAPNRNEEMNLLNEIGAA